MSYDGYPTPEHHRWAEEQEQKRGIPKPLSRNMTLSEFHNALRIMTSIDFSELVNAGVMVESDARGEFCKWEKFRADPYRYLIRADDDTADKIWGIIQARMRPPR